MNRVLVIPESLNESPESDSHAFSQRNTNRHKLNCECEILFLMCHLHSNWLYRCTSICIGNKKKQEHKQGFMA
jgi:hypothetical protein